MPGLLLPLPREPWHEHGDAGSACRPRWGSEWSLAVCSSPAPPGNPLLTSALSPPELRGHEASPTGQGGWPAGVAKPPILVGHLPGQVWSVREEGTQCLPSGSTWPGGGGVMVVILCHPPGTSFISVSYGSHGPSNEAGRHSSLQLLLDCPPASQLARVSLPGHQGEGPLSLQCRPPGPALPACVAPSGCSLLSATVQSYLGCRFLSGAARGPGPMSPHRATSRLLLVPGGSGQAPCWGNISPALRPALKDISSACGGISPHSGLSGDLGLLAENVVCPLPANPPHSSSR